MSAKEGSNVDFVERFPTYCFIVVDIEFIISTVEEFTHLDIELIQAYPYF